VSKINRAVIHKQWKNKRIEGEKWKERYERETEREEDWKI
jgi:hypothetical protein